MISTCSGFEIQTAGFSDVLDITERVAELVTKGGLHNGLATVITPGATASVTTIEFESGAVSDLKQAIQKLAPENDHYDHDARWGDGNGFSHVRAALMGPSLCIPVSAGRLVLGTWQQIVVICHDNHPRKRKINVQLLGVAK